MLTKIASNESLGNRGLGLRRGRDPGHFGLGLRVLGVVVVVIVLFTRHRVWHVLFNLDVVHWHRYQLARSEYCKSAKGI